MNFKWELNKFREENSENIFFFFSSALGFVSFDKPNQYQTHSCSPSLWALYCVVCDIAKARRKENKIEEKKNSRKTRGYFFILCFPFLLSLSHNIYKENNIKKKVWIKQEGVSGVCWNIDNSSSRRNVLKSMRKIKMNLKFSLELRSAATFLVLILTTTAVASLPSSTTTKSSIHETTTSSSSTAAKLERTSKYPPTTSSDANNDVISFGIRSFTVKVSTNERNLLPTTSSTINPNDNRNVINQQMSRASANENENERSKFKLLQQQDDANNSKLFRKFQVDEKSSLSSSSAAASSRQKMKLDDFFPSKEEDFRPILMESSRKLNRTKIDDNKINNRRADMLLLPPLRYNKMNSNKKATDVPSAASTISESVENIKIDDSNRNELSSSTAEISNSSLELIKTPTKQKQSSEADDFAVSEKADTTFKQLRDIGNIDIRIIPPEKRIDLRRVALMNLGERSTNLDCSISNLPQDATIWHGNSTHVLNFPLKVRPSWTGILWCDESES